MPAGPLVPSTSNSGECSPTNALAVIIAVLRGSPRIDQGDSPSATGWKNFRSSSISAQMPP